MPYKDPKNPKNIAQRKAYYERTKEGRYQRIKHNIYKWRLDKPEDYKKSRNKTYYKNKEVYDAKSKEYHRINRLLLNEKWREEIKNLTDKYIKQHLVKLGYAREYVDSNPILIETYRLIIKTKRLCKTSKN